MKLFAFGLSAIAALALSVGTASAQHGGHSPRPAVVTPSHSHGPVVSPGYGGGYLPTVPSYGSGYTPGYGGFAPVPRGHYDYVPAHLDPHRGHLDVKPAHLDPYTPFTPRPRH
jgi:hypothetical protein